MKKGMLKRLSAVVLAAVMAVSLVPVMGMVTNGAVGEVEAKATDVVDSGICGDNLTWVLDSEGTLAISGYGAMYDYDCYDSSNRPPWSGENVELDKIILEEGITSIGKDAFLGCDYLASIVLPDSVTDIGENAFGNCCNLTDIELSNNLKTIGKYAFSDCYNLETVTLNPGLSTIGSYAFKGCVSLTSIEIPASVTYIGGGAFGGSTLRLVDWDCVYELSGLENITVDNNNPIYDSRNDCNAIIKTDSNELIIGCKRTKIPFGVEYIGTGAFAYCGLSSIEIPASIKKIDDFAFAYSNIISCNIPSSVSEIGTNVFYECKSLENIELSTNLKIIPEDTFSGCISISNITIPEGVTYISDYAFYECENLKTITIPSSVVDMGKYLFSVGGLTDIYYTGSREQWENMDEFQHYWQNNLLSTYVVVHFGAGGETPVSCSIVNFTPLATNIERNYNGNFYLPVAVTYKDGSSIEDGKTVRYFCSGVKKADVKTKNGVALIPLDPQEGTYEASFSIIDGNKDYEYENESASITVANKEFSYKETLDMSAKLSFSGTLKKVFGIGVNLKNGMSIEVEEDDGSETVTLKNTGKLSAKASGTLSGKIKKFKAAAEASGSMDGTNTQTMKIKDFGEQSQKAQKAAIGYFLLRSIQNHGDLGIVSVTELDNLYREMYGNYSAFMLTDSEEASVSKEVEKGKLSVGKLGNSQYSLSANGGKTKYTTSVKEDSGKTTYSSGIEKYTGGLKLSGNWIFGLAGGTIYSSEQGVSKTKISASLADGNKEVTGTITSGTTDEISGTKVESETGATLKFTGGNADKLIQNNEKIKKLINGGMPLYTDNDISSIYSSMYGSDLEGIYTLNKKYIEGINLSSSYGIDDSGNSSVGLEVSGTQSYALDAGYGVIYHGYTYPTVDSNYSSYANMISWDLGYSAPELMGLGMEGLTAFLSDAMFYKIGKVIDGVNNKAAKVWSDIKNGWYVSVTSIGNTGSNVKLSSSSVILNTSAEVQDDAGSEDGSQNTGSAISIGDAYTINVFTDNNQETIVSDNDLQKSPVSVRISYADEDLSAYGIDESTENEIKIYYWNSTQQKYQVLSDCKANTDEKYVEGTLVNNGEYVLGVDKEGATISQFEVSDESTQPTITALFDGFSGIEGCLLRIDGTTVIDQTNFSEYYENGVIEYVVTEPLSYNSA